MTRAVNNSVEHKLNERTGKFCPSYVERRRVSDICNAIYGTRERNFQIEAKLEEDKQQFCCSKYLKVENCSSRMHKMCAIPQLISTPLNAIPTVEHHSRRSHTQCEHSYWQGQWVGCFSFFKIKNSLKIAVGILQLVSQVAHTASCARWESGY